MYYHICISLKSTKKSYGEVKLDLTEDILNERVLLPYSRGEPMVVNGKTIQPDDIERMRISTTKQSSEYYRGMAEHIKRDKWANVLPGPSIDWIIAKEGREVTDNLILGPPGYDSDTHVTKDVTPRPSSNTQKVFVVHGRDVAVKGELFKFLRAIGLHPLEWTEALRLTKKANPHIWEILNAAFSEAHAILVLFTPDDEARLRKDLRSDHELPYEVELSGQARPNVLFEAGMAMGRSEDRTVLVELGVLRPFSDIAGRHTIRLDNTSQRRQELAQRLQLAGCPVNLEGTDWHTVGDFGSSS